MSVRIEQENVSPRALLPSPSDCMVVRGGTIPASIHSFPGMEHDRSIFNGQSQELPSNGISQLIGNSVVFDDEREIEAATAVSEPSKKSFMSKPIQTASSTPTVIIPSDIPAIASSSQTLSPLHINVNECSKIDSSGLNSHDSEQSSNGSLNRKKIFQQPSLRMPQRASTSTAVPPIIMGPPSDTNTQVLLSPAGNLHNGYQRMSSGDASPSTHGLANRPISKASKQAHPLAVQRNNPSPAQRLTNHSTFGGQSNRSSSSMASPSGSGRKDHEMTRRRALVDRITKSRGTDYVHLLPQTEGLTHTQTSILLRRHRGTLISEGMPSTLQRLIDCGAEPDRTNELFFEKIKDANKKRIAHSEMDELTDVSDVEEDVSHSKFDSQDRKSPKNFSRWTPKRMRFSAMLSKAEALIEEKKVLIGMLKNQNAVLNGSTGVRFIGEEIIPRRRRRLNGMYQLYDKSIFRRPPIPQNACSRTLPIHSWTTRKLHTEIFEQSPKKKHETGSAFEKPPNSDDKWVVTGHYNTVSYLTNGEKREITEYDFEEYKAGEGIQRVNELSTIDPVNFIVSSDFTPFEDRQMAYMYRLSTAPSGTIRKKHGKSIYFEADDRKAFEQSSSTKKKSDKKKERKPVEEASSDEEEEEQAKEPTKKRPRGRPVVAKRKTSRMSVASKLESGIYLDYLFEDYMNEDICTKQLPNKITYASIAVPHWYEIPDDYWDDVPISKVAPDDMLISVAKQHHRLMHAERDRIKRDSDKRNRNRQTLKSAAATPAHSTFNEDGIVDDGFPPFDMGQFEPDVIKSRRLYSSVEKPYEQRDFLNYHAPQSAK